MLFIFGRISFSGSKVSLEEMILFIFGGISFSGSNGSLGRLRTHEAVLVLMIGTLLVSLTGEGHFISETRSISSAFLIFMLVLISSIYSFSYFMSIFFISTHFSIL